jgi:hypothetical protein
MKTLIFGTYLRGKSICLFQNSNTTGTFGQSIWQSISRLRSLSACILLKNIAS